MKNTCASAMNIACTDPKIKMIYLILFYFFYKVLYTFKGKNVYIFLTITPMLTNNSNIFFKLIYFIITDFYHLFPFLIKHLKNYLPNNINWELA